MEENMIQEVNVEEVLMEGLNNNSSNDLMNKVGGTIAFGLGLAATAVIYKKVIKPKIKKFKERKNEGVVQDVNFKDVDIEDDFEHENSGK